MTDFLPKKEGEIKTESGEVIGKHDGAVFYTLGQRRGLGIGGKQGEDGRWFVVGKDVKENVLYVSCGQEDRLYSKELKTDGFNFISKKPERESFRCQCRIRHRGVLENATAYHTDKGIKIIFDEPVRAIVAGQYAVLYDGEICLGGGEIC
jgi:tRNA-specific 2-thiouridylase